MIIVFRYVLEDLRATVELLYEMYKNTREGLVCYTVPVAVINTELFGKDRPDKLNTEYSVVVDFAVYDPRKGSNNDSHGWYPVTEDEHRENVEKLIREVEKLISELLYKQKVKSLKDDVKYKINDIVVWMKALDSTAKENTTDPKIYVGAGLGKIDTTDGRFICLSSGCNRNRDYDEKKLGRTYREFMFNSRDKKFRPWDKIIHAEENAVVYAIEKGVMGDCDTAIVTRYPCEKCAQLLVYKGIKRVFYGRKFPISEETKRIFVNAGVNVIHVKEYVGDENDDNK